MLENILPKILDNKIHNITINYIVFQGKPDLKKKVVTRLRGFNTPETAFLILCDKDGGNCRTLKQELLDKIPEDKKTNTKVRIACYELESFYLGDLQAVETALHVKIAKLQNKVKFRTPDNLVKPSQELKKLTNNTYQKIAGSKVISKHLNIQENKSKSFVFLCDAIKELSNQY